VLSSQAIGKDHVKTTIESYKKLFDEDKGGTVEVSTFHYPFYKLTT
jgi:hypothetical protein